MDEPQSTPIGGVYVSAPQAIEYIRVEASERASQAARERLSFVLTVIGAIGAGALAVIYYMVDGRVSSKVQEVDIPTLVRAEVTLQIGTSLSEAKGELRQEIQAMAQLPLLLTASGRLDSGSSYNVDDADALIRLAKQISPEILEMSGDSERVALTIIEGALDNFYAASDWQRARQLYDVFGNRLLVQPGIFWTMVRIASEGMIGDEDFRLMNDSLISDIRSASSGPGAMASGNSRRLFSIIAEFAASDYEVDKIRGRYNAATYAASDFEEDFSSFLRSSRITFESDSEARSAFGIENVDRLETLLKPMP